ncbi:unnamed protein product, partial [Protopolystoma xenopodis]
MTYLHPYSMEDRYHRDSCGLDYNLSFAGCGFLGLYHLGVCCCVKEFAPHLYENKQIAGASAGSIAAACLICEVELSECVQCFVGIIKKSTNYVLGPFDPRYKITKHLKDSLEKILPTDAHLICSDRLHISLTHSSSKGNVVINKFKTRDELIKVILCSSFIPVFSGFIPLTLRGESVLDGALSNNLPILNKSTITVSPFAGDADICPKVSPTSGFKSAADATGGLMISNTSFLMNLENIVRLFHIIWPMSPEKLTNLASQ